MFTANGGVFEIDANGDIVFTPNAGFTGLASVMYTVEDNSGNIASPSALSVQVVRAIYSVCP